MIEHWINHLDSIPTPAYLIDEQLLLNNLKKVEAIKKKSGCKIILALKGYATFYTFNQIKPYLDGVTASSIYEARLGYEEFQKELHIHSIALEKDDFHPINAMANHISFNSTQQLDEFKKIIPNYKPSIGIRINPEISKAPAEIYDPCSKQSRLGIPLSQFDPNILNDINGLHFHALCEQNTSPLIDILNKIEAILGDNLHKLEWFNWGGGHLLSDDNYKTEELINRIRYFQEKYNLTVILEPGEAIGRNCGYYCGKVLDIVQNSQPILVTDLSITAHMPDVLEYPYTPEIYASNNKPPHTYYIGGNTCLAGDFIGPYSFIKEKKIGNYLIFLDMGHYTIVKTSNFNGVKQPSIGMINEQGNIKLISNSCYFNFKERLS